MENKMDKMEKKKKNALRHDKPTNQIMPLIFRILYLGEGILGHRKCM